MFTLPFDIPEATQKIAIKDSLFSIGSCFSDNIGAQLTAHKFNAVTNPLGIIYNPYSIFKNLRLLLSEGLDPDNYVNNGDVYFHWDTHSTISGTNLEDFKGLLQQRSTLSKQSLVNADWLIITYGTIYVYKHIDSGEIVANCHKIPQKRFKQLTLTAQEIEEDYFDTIALIRTINPQVKVILTVSPVRHVRDGLMANNYSKGVLLQAVHDIVNKDENSFYFPSYEILIDELRDYRFYMPDMIHPTQQAIDYIWNKFVHAFMNEDARIFIDEWTKVKKSLEHRPFHPHTSDHQQFLKSTISKLEKLNERMDVSTEIAHAKNQLI